MPAHLTALTLVRITYLLMDRLRSLEHLTTVNMILRVRDKVFTLFEAADRGLNDEYTMLQAMGEEHGFSISPILI